MKRAFFITITALLFIISTRAQTTSGTEFWLTFGVNGERVEVDSVDLFIRIVGGEHPTTGTIYFTNLGSSVNFNITAQEVYTIALNNDQKTAVLNLTLGTTNHSVYINSNEAVTVYAMNQGFRSTDATNVLPATILGTDYYDISYYTSYLDAYAVVATENNTQVYHDGELAATLNIGQVYYRPSDTDAPEGYKYPDYTGVHITANNPVALFALNQGVQIPQGSDFVDCLMQQLAPVETWGKNFFVPVSHRTKDRVRIVASQNNTTITQIGGSLQYVNFGQTDYTLQAGQFIELEVYLEGDGCYIQADKPVGVCSYLTGGTYNIELFGDSVSDPAQSWLPAIEQTIPKALLAPFLPVGISAIDQHYALVVTHTETKENTKVSIGGMPETNLSGGVWRDNAYAKMSFYAMPLTNNNASYIFTNQKGLIVMGYGIGTRESYYYLAYSAMRNLSAEFYVNDIYYYDLLTQFFCPSEIVFRAEVTGMSTTPESLRWFINGKEEIAAQGQLTWKKYFNTGDYEIKMVAYATKEDSVVLETTLKIGCQISTAASPPEWGTTEGDNCYRVNDEAVVTAIPKSGYSFFNWTINDSVVSTENPFTFIVSDSCTLVAHFVKSKCSVTIEVNNPDFGYSTGAGDYFTFDTVQVEAFANDCYPFVNWTIDSIEVSTDNPYIFIITENVNFVANFLALDFDTCTLTLWNNTFLLNLRWLRENGYEVSGCRWFKNGKELLELNTIDEYSYCAGTNGDLLEPAPTYYTFQVNTSNFGCINSTKKMITQNSSAGTGKLLVYPNPVGSGTQFTIEGVSNNSLIYVYNFMGVCVGSAIATDSTAKLSLNLPAGIYLIRSENKKAKIVIVE